MKKIKGVIFDLDGVIVDTAKYHYIAWKKLANELGFEFTYEQNERLKGVSRMRSLDILLEIGGLALDEDLKQELSDKKNNWYVEYISNLRKDELLPGAVELITYLKNRGILIALGTASRNSSIILKGLEIEDLFDAIVDGNIAQKAKPDPEVFLKGAKALALEPANCIVFEDAVAGIDAAHAAGMIGIGIGQMDSLANADEVYDSLAEVMKGLNNSKFLGELI